MAKAKAFDKRRKAIRNIRKITRTMELIATARFKKAMDRAQAATSYTSRMTKLVHDLTQAGLEVKHPLLEPREATKKATLLVLTSNRGLCGGYNGAVIRLAVDRAGELRETMAESRIEMSGKRGIAAFKFRGIEVAQTYTQFEDKPTFEQVEVLANRYLEEFVSGALDRLDVAYTKYISPSKQTAVVETLLPLGSLELPEVKAKPGVETKAGEAMYEFYPSAESILEEVVPMSFKIKLFKVFLDAAVSEQIARRVAMKSATENADAMIKELTISYNRARQGQITGELLEIMGGVEALAKQ